MISNDGRDHESAVVLLGLRLKSRGRLEAESLALRHQLNVVCRSAPKGVRPRRSDRLLLIWLYRLWPGVLVPSSSSSRKPSCAGIGSVSRRSSDGGPASGQARRP